MRKPPSAWSLVFVDGPLKDEAKRWELVCPHDYAYTVAGTTYRYRIKERDDGRKVATLELEPTDA